MNIDRAVMAFAGFFVLVGTILGVYSNEWWFVLPLFVGANLLQAAFTGFCPLAKILRAVGLTPGNAF